jgi:hypothetical protein
LSKSRSFEDFELSQARSAIIKLQGESNLYIQYKVHQPPETIFQKSYLIKYDMKLQTSLLKIVSDEVNNTFISQMCRLLIHCIFFILENFFIFFPFNHYLVLCSRKRLHLHLLLSILFYHPSLIKSVIWRWLPWPLQSSSLFNQSRWDSNSLTSVHWNKTWSYSMEKLLWTRR